MVEGLNEYNMAKALLNFKQSYVELCKASRALPELNVSDGYPFYLLDFEEIEPAVKQWCVLHANRLMEQVPDRVDNPACLKCSNFRCGLGSDGLCKSGPCVNYPFIIFTRETCAPALTSEYSMKLLSQKTDSELLVMYINMCNEHPQ